MKNMANAKGKQLSGRHQYFIRGCHWKHLSTEKTETDKHGIRKTIDTKQKSLKYILLHDMPWHVHQCLFNFSSSQRHLSSKHSASSFQSYNLESWSSQSSFSCLLWMCCPTWSDNSHLRPSGGKKITHTYSDLKNNQDDEWFVIFISYTVFFIFTVNAGCWMWHWWHSQTRYSFSASSIILTNSYAVWLSFWKKKLRKHTLTYTEVSTL